MTKTTKTLALAGWCAAGLIPAAAARANRADLLLSGLDFAGFQFTGQHNPLSDGFLISANRQFQNTPLDFGFMDLNLTGPVSGGITVSRRFIPQVEFALQMGVPGNPLAYTYSADTGGNNVTVNGTMIMNVVGSVNEFGWYDMQFQSSNRADIFSSGRFANADGEELDWDIGPVNVSGNLFADALAVVFDPVYDAAGFENVFASFSGRTARENSLESTVSMLEAKMDAGIDLTSREVSNLMTLVTESSIHGDDIPDLSFLNISYSPVDPDSPTHDPRIVPEPSTLALLALSGLLGLRRRGLAGQTFPIEWATFTGAAIAAAPVVLFVPG